MVNLKPCPFCAYKTIRRYQHDPLSFACACMGCGATSGYKGTQELADFQWNQRSHTWQGIFSELKPAPVLVPKAHAENAKAVLDEPCPDTQPATEGSWGTPKEYWK